MFVLVLCLYWFIIRLVPVVIYWLCPHLQITEFCRFEIQFWVEIAFVPTPVHQRTPICLNRFQLYEKNRRFMFHWDLYMLPYWRLYITCSWYNVILCSHFRHFNLNVLPATTSHCLARAKAVGSGSMRPGWGAMAPCCWRPTTRCWRGRGPRRAGPRSCALLPTPRPVAFTMACPTFSIKVGVELGPLKADYAFKGG